MRRVALACAILCALSRKASAAPIEPFVSGGIVTPTTSQYRSTAWQLGYDRGSPKVNFTAEGGVLFAIAFDNRLWIGPALRFDIGRIGAPYGGVDPIRTDAASIAVREELDVFRWPKILLWMDQSLGLGRIGTSAAHTTVPFWGLRFGLALRVGNQRPAMRLRFGYATEPTFSGIANGGNYNFGGFVFVLDGVLRVGE
jgi:hypothetical protein